MKKSNPLERLSEALGGEQGLRQLRNAFGIPSFCYESPIGWIDIIAEGNQILRASFTEEAPFSGPTFLQISLFSPERLNCWTSILLADRLILSRYRYN